MSMSLHTQDQYCSKLAEIQELFVPHITS